MVIKSDKLDKDSTGTYLGQNKQSGEETWKQIVWETGKKCSSVTDRREILVQGSMRVILNTDGLSYRTDTIVVLWCPNN